MSNSPYGEAKSAQQYLSAKLSEMSAPDRLQFELKANNIGAITSYTAFEQRMRHASPFNGQITIAHDYIDRIHDRMKVLEDRPDNRVDATKLYGLNLALSSLMLNYEKMLLQDRQRGAFEALHQAETAFQRKRTSGLLPTENSVALGNPEPAPAWHDSVPDEIIGDADYDPFHRILPQQPLNRTEPETVSVTRATAAATPFPTLPPIPQDVEDVSYVEITPKGRVFVSADLGDRSRAKVPHVIANIDELPVLTDVVTLNTPAKPDGDDRWNPDRVFQRGLEVSKEVGKLQGAELKTFLQQSVIPEHKEVVAAIQASKGTATEAMLNHAYFLNRQISAGKEKLATAELAAAPVKPVSPLDAMLAQQSEKGRASITQALGEASAQANTELASLAKPTQTWLARKFAEVADVGRASHRRTCRLEHRWPRRRDCRCRRGRLVHRL